MIEPINWRRLAAAIEFYQALGFHYVETPWKVDPASARVTCPPNGHIEMVDDLALVASAEQGFIDLERYSLLPDYVNFVSCTPCFRQIDAGRSKYHHPYFMKVELYVRLNEDDEAPAAAWELVHRASRFMKEHGAEDIRAVHLDDGSVDLEINGIEVGSYGYREHPEIGRWAYGTGLAEPRFTQALESK